VRTIELFWRGLRDHAREHGWLQAMATLLANLKDVARDSLPERRRMRFGDIQYDLDRGVNTTWANIGLRTRLREALVGADYQATDPLIFYDAMQAVSSELTGARGAPPFSDQGERTNSGLADFSFVDVGSGKGRVLLMAAEYPFRRIVGVELLPELHEVARENVKRDPRVELVLGDAREFQFPDGPLVVFLFNPFPPWVLRQVLRNVQESLKRKPRDMFVVLHNPEHEAELARVAGLTRLAGNDQFVVYRNV
jgi:SAM-dependent methyltransferase